jgi:hypothetical protein
VDLGENEVNRIQCRCLGNQDHTGQKECRECKEYKGVRLSPVFHFPDR